MIRIKAVSAANVLGVCQLKEDPSEKGTTMGEYICNNATLIAKAKYAPDMYPNAIYNNDKLIGFFMYQRAEDQADTAVICRFMIDYQFQHKGLRKQAFEHVLKGLKIQGVKKVVLRIDDNANWKEIL